MKTLRDHLHDYLEWRRSLMISQSTIEANKKNIMYFIRWSERVYQVRFAEQIKKDHLYEWHKFLVSKTNKEGHLLKSGTINNRQTILRGWLKYMASHGYVPRDFPDEIRYVKKPLLLPGSVLTHAQVRRILKKIPTNTALGYRDRALLELLYTSGIRSGEVLGLNVEDINFKHRTVLVTGKGNKQRVVPIGKTALRHLESYMIGIRPYLLKDPGERALFLSYKGLRLSYPGLLRCIHTHSQREGFKDVTPHTFRRSCTTELIRGGANMYHVKELLGHESLDTLKHYVKLTINDLKKTHQKCHPREKDN